MIGLKTAVVLVLLFIGMLVLNQGLHLMNAPDDMAVLTGVVIMVAYIGVAVWLGRLAFRKIKTRLDAGRSNAAIVVLAVVGAAVLTGGCNVVIPPRDTLASRSTSQALTAVCKTILCRRDECSTTRSQRRSSTTRRMSSA
ncbi:MAG: hypothetical protein WCW47_00080 [Candidatus Paceibacterota bacterium]|jgi:hypothetical protein